MMIKIGIVDDHPLIIHGILQMLMDFPIQIVFTVGSGKELKKELNAGNFPEILLLDIELPDISGISISEELRQDFPDVQVIALSNHDEPVYVRKMFRSGAKGYVLKGTQQQGLIDAIQTVKDGGQFIDQEIKDIILKQAIQGRNAVINAKLTKRELEILTHIANELSNLEIADKLFLSVRTIESHRHSLNQKLNIKTTAGLVKEAYLRGLI